MITTSGVENSTEWSDQRASGNWRFRSWKLTKPGNRLVDNVASVRFIDGPLVVAYALDLNQRTYMILTSPLAGHKGYSGFNAAEEITAGLRSGQDRVLGKVSLHGQPALHLANNEPDANRELWVNPVNFLPIRVTAHGSWGRYRIDYLSIPRTAANLKRLFHTPTLTGLSAKH